MNNFSSINAYIKRNILAFLLIICFINVPQPLLSRDNNDNKVNTVVIDAGHGGKDSGARGKNIWEKEVVLAISLKLGKYIEEKMKDVEVIYTRETDVFIPLHERAEIANKKKADLFISIHANANAKTSAYGAETFVMGLHKTESNLEIAKKENSVILLEEDYSEKYEGFDPKSAESYIIFSLMQNTYLNQSLSFAASVQNQFRERVKRHDRGVNQAGFLVLWKTTMPSVLIETGFISNPKEEKFLASELGQDYLASAIFRAFRNYKNYIENNSNFVDLSSANIKSKKKGNSIWFGVQIALSSQSLETNPENFKGLENINRIKDKDFFRYVHGKTKDYKNAVDLKNDVKKLYPDAFVVAFKENEKIKVKEAIKLVR